MGNIVSLIVLEMILAIVSFPLYLSVASQNVTAFLEERGAYAKVSFDYKLRRILTLTGVAIIAAVWALKLALILLVPTVFGPLQLYHVTNLRPPDLSAQEQQVILEEAGIQNARAVQSLQKPLFEGVKRTSGKDFAFYGTGAPNTTLVLFLTDAQTALYTGTVDAKGQWSIANEQKKFALSEGNHSLSAFSYNKGDGTRSDFADTQYFKVKTTWADMLVRNVDVLANWSVVILIVLGAFLVFLTI
ncbi:MAG: hypothetical protein NTX72_06270 [Candidatus Uhrbacteria bacterium]|nr:hypothetical protein [Candidatus Uhrbacteria bacterium]